MSGDDAHSSHSLFTSMLVAHSDVCRMVFMMVSGFYLDGGEICARTAADLERRCARHAAASACLLRVCRWSEELQTILKLPIPQLRIFSVAQGPPGKEAGRFPHGRDARGAWISTEKDIVVMTALAVHDSYRLPLCNIVKAVTPVEASGQMRIGGFYVGKTQLLKLGDDAQRWHIVHHGPFIQGFPIISICLVDVDANAVVEDGIRFSQQKNEITRANRERGWPGGVETIHRRNRVGERVENYVTRVVMRINALSSNHHDHRFAIHVRGVARKEVRPGHWKVVSIYGRSEPFLTYRKARATR